MSREVKAVQVVKECAEDGDGARLLEEVGELAA